MRTIQMLMTSLSCAAFFPVSLCAQSTYYLPQVIDGPTGTNITRTTITLTNPAATNAAVQISFTGAGGGPLQVSFPMLGSGSRFTLTLQPGGSQILQTDGSGDGSTGAVTITSTGVLGVSTIISISDSNGNLLSESGGASSGAKAAYLIPVDTTGGLNTGVGIFNPAGTPSVLTFKLVDVNGTMLETATATLGAGGHLSRFVAGDLFPDVSTIQGTLAVTASAPVAAVTIRQNTVANVYTLLDAVPQTSMGLNFYLPHVADGPNPTGTLQTTFVLYNLGANPATATLSLAQDSGAPWMVNIPGAGNNSTFAVTLAPGGSTFFQTDGQGAFTTGAASISSTQPIGVAAVVTATDSKGNVLSETGVMQSPLQQTFLLAFDTTNSIDTGLAMFNPGLDPVAVTVSQLGLGGNVIASAQSQPLAPGGHMAVLVSDLFPGTTGVQGALSVTVAGPVGAAVSVLGLRQNGTAVAMASTPVSALPVTGPGINITSTLDSQSRATAAIPPSGGRLALTDTQGNKFTLNIPANALLTTTTVTMTAVKTINGLPAGGTFNMGVQMEPDGLELLRPALLTISPSSPAAAGTIIPLGWRGNGQGVYLNMEQPQDSALTLSLSHFSGAGVGTGSDGYLTSQLLNISNVTDLVQSQIAYWLNMGHNKEVVGQDGSRDFQIALQIYDENYIDIQHLMELALQTGDDDTLHCALSQAVGYERQRELLFNPAPDDPIKTAIQSFLQQALSILEQNAVDQCQKTHDPLAGWNLIGYYLTDSSLGNIGILSSGVLAGASKACSPSPILKFQSEMSATSQFAEGGAGETGTWDSKVSAQVTLTGTIAQDSFDGTGGGYTSYTLSGSGPLNYNSFTFDASGYAPIVGVVCTVAPASASGSTLMVTAPKSEIRYQFTPKFNSQAVRANGQTLAQFCPVFETTPVSVTLALDPGTPQDSITVTCKDVAPITLQLNYWKSTWSGFHMADGGVITGFQFPGGSEFAHKEIDQTVPSSVGPTNEKTTLDLNQQ